jgi:hypothetical protein
LLLITSAEDSWGLANTAELELPQIHSCFMIWKKGEREKKDHAPRTSIPGHCCPPSLFVRRVRNRSINVGDHFGPFI